MALIKSALELALERTKDIEVDHEGLEAREFHQKGMKLAAKIDNEDDLDLAKELGAYTGKHLDWVKGGLMQVLSSCLNLPSNESALTRLAKNKTAFIALSKDQAEMTTFMDELEKFFAQYFAQREQLIAAIQKQAEPALRQKEDQMFQQTGRRVQLTIETDPETAKFLTMNMEKLVQQYQEALSGIKDEILALL